MNVKSNTQYSFTTYQESPGNHSYQVVQLFPRYRLLEGGYGRSRRDAANNARVAIRQLESGTHRTQLRELPPDDWRDEIPNYPELTPMPLIPSDPNHIPF